MKAKQKELNIVPDPRVAPVLQGKEFLKDIMSADESAIQTAD